jgi:hypothetical protein
MMSTSNAFGQVDKDAQHPGRTSATLGSAENAIQSLGLGGGVATNETVGDRRQRKRLDRAETALTLDTDNKRLVLYVQMDRLSNAPGFDKDKWPDMADA